MIGATTPRNVNPPADYATAREAKVPLRAALTRRASGRLCESACHEGNYALRNILSGARAEEAELSRRPK